MRPNIAILYNEPAPSRYQSIGEGKAVLGVLDEVEAVHHALHELGYSVTRVPLRPPVDQARNKLDTLDADLVFNLFEGFDGSPETEAEVALALAETSLPHTGSPSSVLCIALDKARVKSLLGKAGIQTPACQLLTPETLPEFNLTFPCIVKPCGEDASHGISEESVVHDLPSLERLVTKLSRLYGGKALVEEFIDGREFNATVMGNNKIEVLQISEIVYSLPPNMPRILTFSSKWEPESTYFQGTKNICPADINDSQREQITRTALAAFKLLGCRGYARVDMRTDAKGNLNVLEINPNPDIAPDSGAARQARASGMSYAQFIDRIALLGLDRT